MKPRKAVPPEQQPCDADALRAAREGLANAIAWLPSYRMEQLDARIADMPDTYGDFFASLVTPDATGAGAYDFAMCLMMRATLANPKTYRKLAKGGEITVHYGDLEVTGDLAFEGGVMIVLGNLVVGGVLREADEYGHLWVTGSITAKALHCTFTCWVGGAVSADVIVLGTMGSLGAVGGIVTPLAIRTAYPPEDDFYGDNLKATHRIETDRDASGLALLAPSVLRQRPDRPPTLDVGKLLAAAKKGKPLLR